MDTLKHEILPQRSHGVYLSARRFKFSVTGVDASSRQDKRSAGPQPPFLKKKLEPLALEPCAWDFMSHAELGLTRSDSGFICLLGDSRGYYKRELMLPFFLLNSRPARPFPPVPILPGARVREGQALRDPASRARRVADKDGLRTQLATAPRYLTFHIVLAN